MYKLNRVVNKKNIKKKIKKKDIISSFKMYKGNKKILY